MALELVVWETKETILLTPHGHLEEKACARFIRGRAANNFVSQDSLNKD